MAEETRWGTVFMGPTKNRESQLDKIANREEQDLWNRRTEAEYLRRVRDKAVEQLNAMLAEAQLQAEVLLEAARRQADDIRTDAEAVQDEARADRKTAAETLAEADRIRDEAYEEGYGRGVEQALLELDEQRAKIDATTLSVLTAMEGQCGNLFDSWRDELAALVRQSVETGLGWTLREERAEVLDALLNNAVEMLENHRRIVVRANPDDAPAVEEIIKSARRRFHELQSWDIQPDPTLAPGGLVVESVSGKVESKAETRRELVEQTLRHLTLPHSEADDDAAKTVRTSAEKGGIPALEQAVREAEQRAGARAVAKTALAGAETDAEVTQPHTAAVTVSKSVKALTEQVSPDDVPDIQDVKEIQNIQKNVLAEDLIETDELSDIDEPDAAEELAEPLVVEENIPEAVEQIMAAGGLPGASEDEAREAARVLLEAGFSTDDVAAFAALSDEELARMGVGLQENADPEAQTSGGKD